MSFKPKLDQLPVQLNFILPHSLLLDKVKKFKINKKVPRLHTKFICKIIAYENDSKYITCSGDETISIRNSEDNKVIRTLIDHQEVVRDILLLSNRRLVSFFADNKIKIWNLTNGNCEQILIGHSSWVYCLLELPNSILFSGSDDSTIGIWDISRKDEKELQFYDQVKMINNHMHIVWH